MDMHLINGVYLEKNGTIFEIKEKPGQYNEEGMMFDQKYLEPVEKRDKDLNFSKNNKKPEKKEGKREDIDPRTA